MIQTEHTVANIRDEDLLRRAVSNARATNRRGKQPRWVAVMDTFSLGSTFAHQLCARFHFDPDEMI